MDGARPHAAEAVAEGDAVLARRAAMGDVDAFTLLATRHERRVRGFLLRLCGGSVLADDLAQDTFLRAWRKAAAFRGDGDYQGWLLRIAWRCFLSDRRTPRPDAAPLEGQELFASPSDPDLGLDLNSALARLEPRERAVAMLCLVEGYSHGDAAAILQLPLGTTKSILLRARAKLAAVLERSDA